MTVEQGQVRCDARKSGNDGQWHRCPRTASTRSAYRWHRGKTGDLCPKHRAMFRGMP